MNVRKDSLKFNNAVFGGQQSIIFSVELKNDGELSPLPIFTKEDNALFVANEIQEIIVLSVMEIAY